MIADWIVVFKLTIKWFLCEWSLIKSFGCYKKKFVGKAMSVIAANTNVPVSVKCRIGVDDHDSYNQLCKSFYFYFIVYKANNLECCFI